MKLKPDSSIPLEIIYEDKSLIIINKQPGISVHPSINEPENTLANALIANFPAIKNVGENPLRPGLVHRLDKDTSGILVVAKNQKTFEWLKNQWQAGLVEKKYLALIWGHPKKEKGVIESTIGRSPRDFRKRIALGPKNNSKIKEIKNAITEYRILEKFKDFSLVEVRPKTGRMHQIRVHFASIGHPILGDKLYSPKKMQSLNLGLKRQFLHAYFLSFSLWDAKKFAFECDLPEDLKSVLTKIEK